MLMCFTITYCLPKPLILIIYRHCKDHQSSPSNHHNELGPAYDTVSGIQLGGRGKLITGPSSGGTNHFTGTPVFKKQVDTK
jgi:hypothetical protein